MEFRRLSSRASGSKAKKHHFLGPKWTRYKAITHTVRSLGHQLILTTVARCQSCYKLQPATVTALFDYYKINVSMEQCHSYCNTIPR